MQRSSNYALRTRTHMHTQQTMFLACGFRLQVRLAKGRRNFKTATLGERRYFGEMFMLLPEHVPFRGLAQVRAVPRKAEFRPP